MATTLESTERNYIVEWMNCEFMRIHESGSMPESDLCQNISQKIVERFVMGMAGEENDGDSSAS